MPRLGFVEAPADKPPAAPFRAIHEYRVCTRFLEHIERGYDKSGKATSVL